MSVCVCVAVSDDTSTKSGGGGGTGVARGSLPPRRQSYLCWPKGRPVGRKKKNKGGGG